MTTNLPTKSAKQSFLEKAKALSKPNKVDSTKIAAALKITPKLLFSMDATASRQGSWDVAQQITSSMFDVIPGGLKIALAHHSGGELGHVTAFRDDPAFFKSEIAKVRCRAGETALCEILEEATKISRLSTLIYIGDCFEESLERAKALSEELKEKKVPCFMFIEGRDPMAQSAFNLIAEITGGAVFPFELEAVIHIKEKLDAIAAYAAGGIKMLTAKRAELPGAQALLSALSQNKKSD